MKASRPNQQLSGNNNFIKKISGNSFSLSVLLGCCAIFKDKVAIDNDCLNTLYFLVYLLDLCLPHFQSICHLAILPKILVPVIEICITYQKEKISFTCERTIPD
jgi:hypothetical protein